MYSTAAWSQIAFNMSENVSRRSQKLKHSKNLKFRRQEPGSFSRFRNWWYFNRKKKEANNTGNLFFIFHIKFCIANLIQYRDMKRISRYFIFFQWIVIVVFKPCLPQQEANWHNSTKLARDLVLENFLRIFWLLLC